MRMITAADFVSTHGTANIGLRRRGVKSVAAKMGRALTRAMNSDLARELLNDRSLDH